MQWRTGSSRLVFASRIHASKFPVVRDRYVVWINLRPWNFKTWPKPITLQHQYCNFRSRDWSQDQDHGLEMVIRFLCCSAPLNADKNCLPKWKLMRHRFVIKMHQNVPTSRLHPLRLCPKSPEKGRYRKTGEGEK